MKSIEPVASAAVSTLTTSLPAMIRRAADQLASATTAAEVLDAKDGASVVYDAAKTAARIARAKGAHDTLIAVAHRAQADALEIEAAAKRRLADEYDAAQERGEVATNGQRSALPYGKSLATIADIGLTHKDVHEARLIRDAEVADPGIVRRTIEEKLAAGEEPTRAAVKVAVAKTLAKKVKSTGERQTKPTAVAPVNEGGAFARFIELADEIEALKLADLVVSAGRQRAVLGQRASSLADRMSDLMEAIN